MSDQVSDEDVENLLRALPISNEEVILAKVLLPYASRRMAAAFKAGTKFVYYTTAETAAKIITSKEVWMRDKYERH